MKFLAVPVHLKKNFVSTHTQKEKHTYTHGTLFIREIVLILRKRKNLIFSFVCYVNEKKKNKLLLFDFKNKRKIHNPQTNK